MKIINFEVWTRREAVGVSSGHTQTREYNHVNIFLFGWRWGKAITWDTVIDEFND